MERSRRPARECRLSLESLVRLGQESARPRNWGRASAEFVTAALAMLGLPIGLVRLRRMLRILIARDLPRRRAPSTGVRRDRDDGPCRKGWDQMMRPVEDSRWMRGLRSFALGTAASAIWPSYLILAAYMARQAPWPRQHEHPGLGQLAGLALLLFLHGLLRWLTRPSGWAERYLGDARAGGPATGASRPIRDRGGCGAAPAGLPDR